MNCAKQNFKTKLLYSMEACYINTAHPDFLSGHQAIAIVNEQLQAKNQPAQITDKQHSNATQNGSRQQQLASLQTNTHGSNFDFNSDSNGSFFGSFFSGPKNKKKSAGGLMEAVSL
jgi:dynamin 1-like protein